MSTRTLSMVWGGAISAATALVATVATAAGTLWQLPITATAVVVITLCASRQLDRRLQAVLGNLRAALADEPGRPESEAGIAEFDHFAAALNRSARRWESVAAETRRQTQGLQTLLQTLDRRDPQGEPTHAKVRGILSGIGGSLANHLAQVHQAYEEAERRVTEIAESAENQGHAIVKTRSLVDQLNTSIQSVLAVADRPEMPQLAKPLADADERTRQLADGLRQIHTATQHCERKLSGLGDPARELHAIVQSIADLAARTDLLALNASIESIRAGEHGKGLAIVADEVRRLAEQTGDATREVTALLDSMQLVIQEAARGLSQNGKRTEAESERLAEVRQAVERIAAAHQSEQQHWGQLVSSSQDQLRWLEEVATTAAQMAAGAKSSRGATQAVLRSLAGISQSIPQAAAIAERLAALRDTSHPAPQNRPQEPAEGDAGQRAVPITMEAPLSTGVAVG